MENFCRKSCDECGWKEELNCPGCQNGPGRQLSGDCKIAKCCREKGHQTCSTCGFWDSCWTKKDRDRMPEMRIREAERRAEEQRKFNEWAPILGKWLWLLFWLFLPGIISGIMTEEKVLEILPVLRIPGHLLGIGCSLAYGAILIKLTPFTERYRFAGWCAITGAGISHLVSLIGLEQQNPLWWLLMLPAVAVAYVAEYQEFHAHADVLESADAVLAQKWRTLWKWFIGALIALFGCIIVVLITPMLGVLVMLAAVITMSVVSIVKLVYLYQTAQWFRSRCPAESNVLSEKTET